MSMNGFLQAFIANVEHGSATAYFKQIVGALDAVYLCARRIYPTADNIPATHAKFLMICEKSMRSAAIVIASRQPEDSTAITRRAIEAARTALAIKLNDENATNWLAFDKRMERWAKREVHEKPKSLFVDLGVKGDGLFENLGNMAGVLSDVYVHFTPEFYSSLSWDATLQPGIGARIVLNFFRPDEREIERQYLILGTVHKMLLEAFDRCVDGRLMTDKEFYVLYVELLEALKKSSDQYCLKYPDVKGDPTMGLGNQGSPVEGG
jgi:hypothetical protein